MWWKKILTDIIKNYNSTSIESVRDWAVVYEHETGDSSLRKLERLDTIYYCTYNKVTESRSKSESYCIHRSYSRSLKIGWHSLSIKNYSTSRSCCSIRLNSVSSTHMFITNKSHSSSIRRHLTKSQSKSNL